LKLKTKKFSTTYYIPKFRCNTVGNSKIIEFRNCMESGYFSNSWRIEKMVSLLKRDDNTKSWDIWMSLSPSEIESQEAACDLACGHTVIMGLGLGFSALNIAMNNNVKKVSVIENDKDIIMLFNKSIISYDIPKIVMDKISIIHSDAFDWKPSGSVEFLYIDIWLEINNPNALSQVKLIQKNILAKEVFFWGQEVLISSRSEFDNIEFFDKKNIGEIRSILGIDIALKNSKIYFNMVKKIKYKHNIKDLYNNNYSRKIYG